MADFTLDKSGEVEVLRTIYRQGAKGAVPHHIQTGWVSWTDLSPFEQGYVEALFASGILCPDPAEGWGPSCALGFSDLAPETLAAIRKDCATLKRQNPESAPDLVWAVRQTGAWPDFPPLTPYLADDGKVCLREST